MKTTLNKIKTHNPCKDGWKKLLNFLGKTKADDEELSILTILESNGFDDTIWCLRAVDGYDKEIRLFAVWCARQVQHLMEDERSINVLDVAERFANGKATKEELELARAEARNITWTAIRAETRSRATTTRTTSTSTAHWTAASAADSTANSSAASAANSAIVWATDSAIVWAADSTGALEGSARNNAKNNARNNAREKQIEKFIKIIKGGQIERDYN